MDKNINQGDAMVLTFAVLGFMCFCTAIIFYLRAEDAAYKQTYSYIAEVNKKHEEYAKSVNAYIDGLHKTLDLRFEAINRSFLERSTHFHDEKRHKEIASSISTVQMHAQEIRKDMSKKRVVRVINPRCAVKAVPVKSQKPKLIKTPANKKHTKRQSHASH